ncbi:MAG: sigma-54 interaction domain-containing protein [Lentisphaeria bacterium]|jgi:DNA-binding NtrC family response regulator
MMSKTLILTGWGYRDYAFAAALALRHFKGADILGMSKRRLPEFLESVEGYTDIAILGVGLSGNPERLAEALKNLRKKKVQVVWISALDFPAWMENDIKANLNAHIAGGDVFEATAIAYEQDTSDLLELLDDKTAIGKKYERFLDAAMYFYRNYQDEQAYSRVIRHIAAAHTDSAWTDAERGMIEHFKRYGSREFAGKSAAIADLQDKINRIAQHERARVLIYGETGTGKETAATLLHNKSSRKDEPLIAFNCASVTPNLLESRFLGHEKGAFTGATEARAGVFEAADGGTLFLDEIGELPLEVQGTLLRVLEGGRFYRLGNNKTETEVDVRVIAATNRDLPAMVREGKFREDLYHRLNIIQLRLPPLREHREDIPDIVRAFRKRTKMPGQLTQAQLEALMDYDYPGNVRELFNLLERAEVLGISDYRQLIREHKEINAGMSPKSENTTPDNLEEVTRLHIKRVCEKYNGNITKAAEALGTSRNTVRKYL